MKITVKWEPLWKEIALLQDNMSNRTDHSLDALLMRIAGAQAIVLDDIAPAKQGKSASDWVANMMRVLVDEIRQSGAVIIATSNLDRTAYTQWLGDASVPSRIWGGAVVVDEFKRLGDYRSIQ